MFKNSEFNINPELIVDKAVEIRLAHAKDVDSSPELLKVLMEDKFWYVRDFVASNSSTPDEYLEILCNDKDFRVRDSAKRNLSERGVFEKSALDDTLRTVKHIAQNKLINNKLVFNEINKERDL